MGFSHRTCFLAFMNRFAVSRCCGCRLDTYTISTCTAWEKSLIVKRRSTAAPARHTPLCHSGHCLPVCCCLPLQ